LQRDAGQDPQVCITLPILRGLDGHRRMGKSLQNYVGVGDTAYEMFAKTMSIPDELMREWFELLTERTQEEIQRLTDPTVTHPMKAKQRLGTDIVAFYYGEETAAKALAEWDQRFSQKKDPSQPEEVPIPRVDLVDGKVWICQLLVRCGLAKSNNEARRLLGPNSGVTIGPNRERVTDPTANVSVYDGLIVRVGSKRVVLIRLV
jgi:tyrosyl-tRNA synthetase